MSSAITYDDIKKFDSTYTYWTHAKKAVTGTYEVKPGKKRFKQLIKRAAQSTPKEEDKQA